jgi:xanthine dehydrogenase accessory factor
MRNEVLDALVQARRAHRVIVRAVDLQTGEETLIDPETDSSPLGIEAAAAARADTSATVSVDGREWFLSVFNPPLDLVITGAVHIAQSLAPMAGLAGYGVRIIDPRTAFATQARFPENSLSHDWPDEALRKAPLGPRSALVTLAHDPKIDDPALITALQSSCFYIGALGSKKTHAARLVRLREHGLSDAVLARIHGPIGLAIGGRSPAEIAIAILAEMTQELRTNGGRGQAAARASA